LHIPDDDSGALRIQSHDRRGERLKYISEHALYNSAWCTHLILYFSEQFFLSDIINPERFANTGDKPSLEGHYSEWNIVRLSLHMFWRQYLVSL
jgi:hypothetical protein